MASSANEALQALREHAVHAIVCDIAMPGKDGYEFIQQARKQGCRVPALAVTAFARAEDKVRAILAGYQGHLPKPIVATELVLTVATLAKSTTVAASRNPVLTT